MSEDTAFRWFPRKDLKIVQNYPITTTAASKYGYLGVIVEEKKDEVKVQIYGLCKDTSRGIALLRRTKVFVP